MEKRKPVRRGRAYYEKVLSERAREGLSYEALSKRTGVPLSSLQRWGRRLKDEVGESAPAFVELTPSPTAAPEDRVEVALHSGRTLSLPLRPPFEGLGELVKLLESC